MANNQHWRNYVHYDWNNDCRDRVPRGDWFASGREINILFAMIWDLNQRVTIIENMIANGSGNTNITPQLQALTANLNASSTSLQNIINKAK